MALRRVGALLLIATVVACGSTTTTPGPTLAPSTPQTLASTLAPFTPASATAAPGTANVTFSSSEDGQISPSGEQNYALAQVVDVGVRPNDVAWSSGLLVDGRAVPLEPASDGSSHYQLTVT